MSRRHGPTVVQQVGADNIMWSNDYPRGMSTGPLSRERARTTLAGLQADELAADVGFRMVVN